MSVNIEKLAPKTGRYIDEPKRNRCGIRLVIEDVLVRRGCGVIKWR